MEWLNEPRIWKKEGNRIDITAEPGTDMWREPVGLNPTASAT